MVSFENSLIPEVFTEAKKRLDVGPLEVTEHSL
jgi:hypothetical protein